MSEHVRDASSKPPSPEFQYPFASAPDIIRGHQKDAYFQGVLFEKLSTVLRTLHGARVAHTYAAEARTLTDLVYLCLTTLVANRTLGEEYCDIVQVEDDTLRLPSLSRRSGYIISSVLLPYGLMKILPAFRRRLRSRLEVSLRASSKGDRKDTWSHKLRRYLVANIDAITSPSPIYALSLATFYFSGAYYQLAKRVWGLRYIFTRRLGPSEQRIGYEVLGVLLTLQLAVQAYMHVHSTYSEHAQAAAANANSGAGAGAMIDGGVEVSLDPNSYASNHALLFDADAGVDTDAVQARIRKVTHTPKPPPPSNGTGGGDDAEMDRPDGVGVYLGDAGTMSWIESRQQRKCTLCLEPMKDPSATTCGHVFCWACIRDWLAERAECPLCRQGCAPAHVLPLRS